MTFDLQKHKFGMAYKFYDAAVYPKELYDSIFNKKEQADENK